MKVGLIDVDGHNFPNLCLMKLSAYHQSLGDNVEWYDKEKHYDLVYKSKVFSDEYSIDNYTNVNSDKVISGGTGYNLKNVLPKEIEHIYPDYELYQDPKFQSIAYGFLTRGCPRGCPFCIVAEKEGKKSVKVADLEEFWRGQKLIKLLDPNTLACRDNESLLLQLLESKAIVDFTQGVDARLLTEDNAQILRKIRKKMIHFAFDQLKDEKMILRGLKFYKGDKVGPISNASVYILTNFNTSLSEDFYRVRKIMELGFMPDIRACLLLYD